MSIKRIFISTVLLALLIPVPAISQSVLLIIAPDEFIDELEPLKRFKDASVRPTVLLSLTQVHNSFYGADVQENIKLCIAWYHQFQNIQAVMLVGDCDMFPVRYCRAINTQWGSKYYPSDLYYADLYKSDGSFDDWDNGDPPYGNNKIYGEMDFTGFSTCDTNILNLDRINMYPDVAVARVPASNDTEVTTYVNKIINYELGAPGDWFKRALWVIDCDVGSPEKMDRLDGYLSDFEIIKTYSDPKWCNGMLRDQRASIINQAINAGVGFVNYSGHGCPLSWAWVYDQVAPWYDMNNLTNKDKLPVVFASSCYTARFHFHQCITNCIRGDSYRDINGNEWTFSNNVADRPEPMAVQPAIYDRESLAEEFLVKRNSGGISYIGCTSKSEFGGDDLNKYFFEAFSLGVPPVTLGFMWNYALNEWLNKVSPCHYYAYIHMHKMMLFGDPSLIVGGAFTIPISGDLYDLMAGPWWSAVLYSTFRYRITGNITVPAGKTLTAQPYASVLFENGKKITAVASGSNEGFRANGTSDLPVYFISLGPYPQPERAVRGVKVSGQLRLRNGGEIKLF